MREFLVYFRLTGEIWGILSGSEPVTAEIPEGCDWIEGGGDPDHHYVSDALRERVDRPVMDLQLPSLDVSPGEVFRVASIPMQTRVEYPGGELTIDNPLDNFIEQSFVEPGEYQFRLTNWPYREEVFDARVSAV